MPRIRPVSAIVSVIVAIAGGFAVARAVKGDDANGANLTQAETKGSAQKVPGLSATGRLPALRAPAAPRPVAPTTAPAPGPVAPPPAFTPPSPPGSPPAAPAPAPAPPPPPVVEF
jgi:hypothetical protein